VFFAITTPHKSNPRKRQKYVMSSSKVNKRKEVASGPDRHTTVPRSSAANNPFNKQRSKTVMDSSQMALDNTPRTIRRLSPEHLDESGNTPLVHKRGSGRSSIPSVLSSGSARLRVSAAATSAPIDKLTTEAVDNDRDGSSSPVEPLFDEENDCQPENPIDEEQVNRYSRERGTPTTPGALTRRYSNLEGSGYPSAKRSHTAMMGEEEYVVQVGRSIANLDVQQRKLSCNRDRLG
jgi:hypothetical protein